ncbi:MAG: hypothetical protein GY816_01980 [Cytophagales bacterium]|nr:hypothetical protein [Cytophagales bacterium]
MESLLNVDKDDLIEPMSSVTDMAYSAVEHKLVTEPKDVDWWSAYKESAEKAANQYNKEPSGKASSVIADESKTKQKMAKTNVGSAMPR